MKLTKMFIIVNPKDNVATAKTSLRSKKRLMHEDKRIITLKEDIPAGYKMAIREIHCGDPVINYGERIGLAAKNILPGEKVHIHNLEGERGRAPIEV